MVPVSLLIQRPDPRSLRRRPADDLLSDGTTMGAVELLVKDLDGMIAYYSTGVTLDVLQHSGDTAVLGHDGRVVLRLRRVTDLPSWRPNQAGLFHTAVLFDDDAALARALASMARFAPGTFTGSADHLYSQAFYFTDPEGNGVELYADRPRETWQREANGLLSLASNYLDPNEFLRTNLSREAPQPTTAPASTLGHVHLQVGDIPTGREFYVDTLGFEVMSDAGSALFISAGGYHHHIALNTWNSAGAGPRAASLGLGQVNIDLPTGEDIAALEERLTDHRVTTRHDGAVLRFEDPWGTLIQVAQAPAPGVA
ncbi:VOC family protein [Kocuria rhizophila]|uniref:VOC family protein n=1 Tax=Kocuria rhizophila TaxID=72000 RepID=UPI001D77E6D2|nr:VOC family protein [Kocuria rhizophila]MCC5673690.1 VOC family protein [Kocuria rhizophila]